MVISTSSSTLSKMMFFFPQMASTPINKCTRNGLSWLDINYTKRSCHRDLYWNCWNVIMAGYRRTPGAHSKRSQKPRKNMNSKVQLKEGGHASMLYYFCYLIARRIDQLALNIGRSASSINSTPLEAFFTVHLLIVVSLDRYADQNREEGMFAPFMKWGRIHTNQIYPSESQVYTIVACMLMLFCLLHMCSNCSTSELVHSINNRMY
mmetsp:Transcript_42719/g.89656  ORF Transcript_42719/g.89656 Transcript_42719/m.89656 type:complete len:207 (+) Transcript_42719:101-721(+)